MDVRQKSFVNRKKYWEKRHESVYQLNATELGESTPEMPHSIKSIGELNATFSNVRQCPFCKNREPALLSPVKLDDLQLTECLACRKLIGADDTMTPNAVDAFVKSLHATLCPCGNSDCEKYTLQQRGEHDFYWRCEACQNKISCHDNANYVPVSPDRKTQCDDPIKLTCSKCGNVDTGRFDFYVSNDRLEAVECLACHNFSPTHSIDDYADLSGDEDPFFALDSFQDDEFDDLVRSDEACNAVMIGRKYIKHARDIKIGDHIAWWRPLLYWHHALVEEVYPDEKALQVIHYTGPEHNGGVKLTCRIKIEKLFLDEQAGVLYKMVYSSKCFSPVQALSNAYTRLQENTYNLFTNNCEHFVRWCKTGLAICEQLINAKDMIKKYSHLFMQLFAGPITQDSKNLWLKAALQAMRYRPLSLGHSAIAVLAFERKELLDGFLKANDQRKDGVISEREFVNVIVSSSLQTGLRGSGTITGQFIGSTLIPIPLVGGVVGATLGALIGHFSGSKLGYKFTEYNNTRNPKCQKYLSVKK